MSKRDNEPEDTGDTAQTRRVKLAIGGAVLELFRKWGAFGLIGWIAVQQGIVPVPGIEPIGAKKTDNVPRSEFDVYRTEHEKWGLSVIERIDDNVAKLDLKMDRVIDRLDRALDKRLVAGPAAVTNAVARRALTIP